MGLLNGTHARHVGVGGVFNMHWNLAGTDISEDHDAILDPSSWLAIIFVIESSRLSSYAAQLGGRAGQRGVEWRGEGVSVILYPVF